MIDQFVDAVTEFAGLGLLERHRITRTAKLVRARIDEGEEPSDAEWQVLFPNGPVRKLAQSLLGNRTPVMDLDEEATLKDRVVVMDVAATMPMSPQAMEKKWYLFLTDIPDEGIPSNENPLIPVDGWELGRMVVLVSKGQGEIDYERIPTDGGFREELMGLAREAGKLECIKGIPASIWPLAM